MDMFFAADCSRIDENINFGNPKDNETNYKVSGLIDFYYMYMLFNHC